MNKLNKEIARKVEQLAKEDGIQEFYLSGDLDIGRSYNLQGMLDVIEHAKVEAGYHTIVWYLDELGTRIVGCL